jgi:hypothetical protein
MAEKFIQHRSAAESSGKMVVRVPNAVNRSASIRPVWWLLFTAVDLYLGLIILDTLACAESVPHERRARLLLIKKLTIGLLIVTAIAIILVFVSRRFM